LKQASDRLLFRFKGRWLAQQRFDLIERERWLIGELFVHVPRANAWNDLGARDPSAITGDQLGE
jgi:hypothetical protein